jgi:hypothetical protein
MVPVICILSVFEYRYRYLYYGISKQKNITGIYGKINIIILVYFIQTKILEPLHLYLDS